VDAVAEVVRLTRTGADVRLRVALAPEIAPFVAYKGSIALNGVSLTVAGLSDDSFEVALIPETLSRTNLGTVRAGGALNVEVDLLARYLDRLRQRE
jgi:riboflavin synthase